MLILKSCVYRIFIERETSKYLATVKEIKGDVHPESDY